jgi:peptidoglycan/xylan/chitin deacetylase (PgdA/CDA1 family)
MKKDILKNSIANLISNKLFIRAYRPVINYTRNSYGCVIVNFHQFYKNDEGILKKGPSVHTHVDDFGELIDLLLQRFQPISMDTLSTHLHTKKPLENDSFLITMDDGYENNLVLGAPILNENKIRATLYVATGFIGANKKLPMDMIDHALRTTRKIDFYWDYIKDKKLEIDNTEKLRSVNNRIGEVIKYLPTDKLKDALENLYGTLDVDLEFNSNSMLDWNQVKLLINSDIDIGSHGISHTSMTTLKEKDAIDEIHESKKEILNKAGYNAIHFAFPNGMEKDFNDNLRKEAIKAGYRSIASVKRGINIPGKTNPYDMNRIGMFDSPKRTILYIEKMFFSEC